MKRTTWINVLVGIWLIFAPFALPAVGLTNNRAANDVVLGILLIACSWWMLVAMTPPAGLAWLEVVCGVWLIAAPFVLGYSGASIPLWNDAICGMIAVIVGAIATQAIMTRPAARV